jgi:hypothetical protein
VGTEWDNELSGEFHGPVVQAGTISGGVHFHHGPVGATRQAEADRARRHAAEVDRARGNVADGDELAHHFTRVAAFLHRELMRAQEEAVRLTWERDHRDDDRRRREESAGRARDAERRTIRQLDRATATRLTALRLALVARAQLDRLAPGTDDEPTTPPPLLDSDLTRENVDRWLDHGDGGLKRLAEALGEPIPGSGEHADPPAAERAGDLLGPLVDALAKVPLLAHTPHRAQVVQLLGHRAGVALSVPESPHLRVHVASIVLACLGQADGLADLLTVLELLEPNTLQLAEVRRIVDRWR